MPSKSAKQAKFMRAVAHSPKFAKKVGVSQKVGKEFEMADKKKRKFADGGSSKYDERYKRKIADIEKDFAKASKGKTGKAADVAKAKYEQRMADAKDDLAKWTKSDRTQTRAAEKSAERNLSMTRKFGAMKSATEKDVGTTARVSAPTDVVKAPSIDRSFMPKASATKPKATPKQAPKTPPAQSKRVGDQGFAYKSKTTDGRPAMGAIRDNAAKLVAERKAMEKRASSSDQGFSRKPKNMQNIGADKGSEGKRTYTSAESRARAGKMLSYLNPFSYLENKAQRLNPSEMAKGGTVKKPMPKEGTTGGASTVPMTPERKEFLDRMKKAEAESKKGVKPNTSKYANGGSVKERIAAARPQVNALKGRAVADLSRARQAMSDARGMLGRIPAPGGMMRMGDGKPRLPGMKKGGDVMKKSDKAGRALVKKSADTMGRAMMKKKAGGGKCYAKGGSVSSRADGIAKKGKTKGKIC